MALGSRSLITLGCLVAISGVACDRGRQDLKVRVKSQRPANGIDEISSARQIAPEDIVWVVQNRMQLQDAYPSEWLKKVQEPWPVKSPPQVRVRLKVPSECPSIMVFLKNISGSVFAMQAFGRDAWREPILLSGFNSDAPQSSVWIDARGEEGSYALYTDPGQWIHPLYQTRASGVRSDYHQGGDGKDVSIVVLDQEAKSFVERAWSTPIDGIFMREPGSWEVVPGGERNPRKFDVRADGGLDAENGSVVFLDWTAISKLSNNQGGVRPSQ